MTEYATQFGSLEGYEKGSLEIIDDDPDVSPEGGLVGLVQGAYTPRADLLDDLVVADRRAGRERHESPSTRNASTAARRPLSSRGPSSVARTPGPASARAAAEQITSPAFACPCKRAATF